ncbi:MAG: alpha/beta hydrolase-fold protein [Jatrophihabitans sp.]
MFALALAGVIAVGRARSRWIKLLGGFLAMVLCATGGIAVVNDYYGYYTSWGQLSADLSDSYQPYSTAISGSRTVHGLPAGRVEQVNFVGKRSGINRPGLVYLPPQYFEPAYRQTRFPVVELIHGSPGHPTSWIVNLNIARTMDHLLVKHQIGPMVFVMPAMNDGNRFEEGIDAPPTLDDTYLSTDVRTDVLAHFRVATDAASWGIAGYSSGGYAAANLSLRHPYDFGAAAMMDGYFRPKDGPAAQAAHGDAAIEAANDPLRAAAGLSADSHPLPSFWVGAGTGSRSDITAARAFVSALHGVEQVTLYTEKGAIHNFNAWRADIPRFLTWMWPQLAPPALRVQFPISGPVHDAVIPIAKPRPSSSP